MALTINQQSPDGLYVEFPAYQVKVPGSSGRVGLGHGAVIAVDEDTGTTRGSEYGRYDRENQGVARRISVPSFRMKSPGNPTSEELDNYARQLDAMYGHSGGVTRVHYIKGADEDKMIKLMQSAESGDRENGFYVNTPYRILDHNCGTYGAAILKRSMPWYKFSGFGPYTWGTPHGIVPYWGPTGEYIKP